MSFDVFLACVIPIIALQRDYVRLTNSCCQSLLRSLASPFFTQKLKGLVILKGVFLTVMT